MLEMETDDDKNENILEHNGIYPMHSDQSLEDNVFDSETRREPDDIESPLKKHKVSKIDRKHVFGERYGFPLRRDFVLLEYRADKPLIRSIGQKWSHYFDRFGITSRNCRDPKKFHPQHFLLPEESLWLAEQGAAQVVDLQGRTLVIGQLYATFFATNNATGGQFKLTPFQYAVFVQLTQSGYTLRRPKPSTNAVKTSHQQTIPFTSNVAKVEDAFDGLKSKSTAHLTPTTSDETMNDEDLSIPSSIWNWPEQFDNFPTISTSCRHLMLHEFTNDMHFPTEGLLGNIKLNADWLRDASSKFQAVDNSKQVTPILRGLCRDHEPWLTNRPRWWPSLGHVRRTANSWTDYEHLRAGILSKHLKKKPQFRNGNYCSFSATNHSQSSKEISQRHQPSHHYDVFTTPPSRNTSSSSSVTPAYRLLIIEHHRNKQTDGTSEENNLPLLSHLIHVHEEAPECPLLVAQSAGSVSTFRLSRFEKTPDGVLQLLEIEMDQVGKLIPFD